VSGDASAGTWQRGIPAGAGDRGDPADDFDGSGYCYLTGNASGDSDIDDGTTNLASPLFDLSAGDALIHYARWYSNDYGANPNTDTMRVYISNNNGASWTLVEMVGPTEQASGNWYEKTFWTGDFIEPTSQMRLRFEASDLNAASVVEAAIDDVNIVVYNCGSMPLSIATDSLPTWTAGHPFSQTLTASGGSGTLTWADEYGDLSGTGLTLSSTGLLSGTVASAGSISFTAQVTDAESQNDDQLFTLTVNDAISITTSSVPDWTAGYPYSTQLATVGGTGVKSWTDMDGDLAGSGLSLSSTGLLSGTPTGAGSRQFTALVTDQVGATSEHLFNFVINAAVSITTLSMPGWTVDRPYSVQLASIGGTGGVAWTDKNLGLAGSGLTLSSAGLVSGTPTSVGTVSFTAMITDQVSATSERPFNFAINPSVMIATETLPVCSVGVAYNVQLTATGGTGTIVWSDWDNSLAGTGLTLSSTGAISGTATEPVTKTFTARAADATGSVAEKPFQFTIIRPYECGDANGDGHVNVADAVFIISYIFRSGPTPVPLEAANANCDGSVNIADAVYLISYIFRSGPAPCCP
ncbi:MAG: putative Ig domain-containing protein, partial [candidate division Zixibacteria bacterium]|nr:putative Ig domain-containing protein [candidate division Zixibacteria bacterium]